jgi:hypothetical protein
VATRRLSAAAVSAFAIASLWPSAAAESRLTPRNSVVASLLLRDSIGIDGVGCGVPASATLALPSGAFDVHVRRPLVGARDVDAHLTGVSATRNRITFTAVADSADVCDPNADTRPPANRPWSAEFDVAAGFQERAMVVLWNLDPLRGMPFTARPRQVQIGLAGAARNIRWKQFGGRTAIGFGAFKSVIPCAGGCTDNGTRLRVQLTRPVHCPGEHQPRHKEDVVFYGRVAFVLAQRLGVLKPGTEWISTKLLTCPLGGTPVPVR